MKGASNAREASQIKVKNVKGMKTRITHTVSGQRHVRFSVESELGGDIPARAGLAGPGQGFST